MEDKTLKHIQVLFDEPSQEVNKLAQKLGEHAPYFSDDHRKLSEQTPGFVVRDDKQMVWQDGVSGVIHPEHLTHPVLEYLIRRAQSREFSVDMNESYEDFDKKVHSYRFIDPFEEGEIGDQLAHLIFKAGFDPLPFKTFHTAMMGYVAHHVKRRNMMLPIDVQLGVFQGCFAFQVMVSAHLFVREHLVESFGSSDVNNPYHAFLRTCFENAHLFDIATIKSPEKIIFTGIWCHDQYKLPGGSLLCHSVPALKTLIKTIHAPLVALSKDAAHFHDLHLSGDAPMRFERKDSFSPDHPHLANMVIDHCLKAGASAEHSDAKVLARDFAPTNLLEKLNERDWDLINEALGDTSVREMLQAEVKTVVEGVDEEVFEKISKVFSRMSLNEATTLVAGKIEEDDFKQIVSGKIDLPDNSVTIVRGSDGQYDPNEIWEIKKQNILTKTREKWLSVQDKKLDQDELMRELCLVVQAEVGLTDNLALQIVKGTVDSAVDEVASERLRQQREHIKQQNQDKYFKEEIAKRDKQIRRMKGILDNIKAAPSLKKIEIAPEMANILDGDGYSGEINPQTVINRLNGELEMLKRQLREREILHERDADTHLRLFEDLEKKMNFYRERSEEDKNLEKEVLSLSRENERLKNQSRLGDTRVEHMSERIVQERTRAQDRESKKLAAVERKVTLLEIEKQRYKEKIDALTQENELLKKANTLAPSQPIVNVPQESKNTTDQRELLQTIEDHKNKARESDRIIKEQRLKLRQLEQKLKFTSAQLERRSAQPTRGAASSSGNANEQRLEKINEKLKHDVSAQLHDLNERKKEAVKLRIENNQLQNRINELERQLQKKAS